MKAAKYILIIIGVGIIGFVLYALNQPDIDGNSVFDNMLNEERTDSEVGQVEYRNEAGETFTIEYDNDNQQVIVYHVDGSTQVLPLVVSASGAKFANADESYVVWNKGNTITVFQNEVVVFEGVDSSSQAPSEDTNQQNQDIDESVTSPDLLGQLDPAVMGSWKWEKTEMSSDEGFNPQPKSDKFVIRFTADGRISGETDCNGFMGSYNAQKGSLTIGELATTLMFCEDSQEADFHKIMNNVDGYMITDKGQLVLLMTYDSGSVFFSPVTEKDQA